MLADPRRSLLAGRKPSTAQKTQNHSGRACYALTGPFPSGPPARHRCSSGNGHPDKTLRVIHENVQQAEFHAEYVVFNNCQFIKTPIKGPALTGQNVEERGSGEHQNCNFSDESDI